MPCPFCHADEGDPPPLKLRDCKGVPEVPACPKQRGCQTIMDLLCVKMLRKLHIVQHILY